MTDKKFHVCQLLAAGRGFICYPDKSKSNYDVLDEIISFMHNRERYYFGTMGLKPAQEACEETIMKQFPFIEHIILPTIEEQKIFSEVDFENFAKILVEKYGEFHSVYDLTVKPSDLTMAFS